MKSRLSLSNNISALSNSKNEYYDVTSDEIGNITSYDGLNYTWVGRQLKSVSQVGNPSVGATYSYNSDGQRIGKNITLDDGETYDYDYYYNGDILAGYKLVITKSDGSSTTHNVAFMYDENGEAFGFNYNGNDYYYVRNAQNDVIFISNSDNTGVVMYQYDAWGNMTACYDTSDDGMLSIINPYAYRGYFYEFETNTYFLKSRYYNPELCRFISADSQLCDDILGNNTFTYCSNNPISRSDKDGKLWWVAAGAIIGAVVGAASRVASNIVTQKKWYEGIAGAAFGGAISGAIISATGNIALGSFVGAATESLTNQVISYTKKSKMSGSKRKTVTKNNIVNSAVTVAKDTIVNGTVSTLLGEMSIKIIPTNDGWIRPQKFASNFLGKYAVRLEGQAAIEGFSSTSIEVVSSMLSLLSGNEQNSTITIYPEIYVEE